MHNNENIFGVKLIILKGNILKVDAYLASFAMASVSLLCDINFLLVSCGCPADKGL